MVAGGRGGGADGAGARPGRATEGADRPAGNPGRAPATGYYPSGHTATAVVAYGTATLFLLPLLRSAAGRRLAVAGCAVLVLAVSFGLVRRGYHWPLDVVASWCLGVLLLTGLRAAAGRVGGPGP